jgi:exopolysaccharide biosynthesis polyprenyl glycosylphosphotransferase
VALEFGLGGFPALIRRLIAGVPQMAGALVAALVVGSGISVQAGLIVGVSYLMAGYLSVRAARWRWLLPLAGTLATGSFPVIGSAFSVVGLALLNQPVEARPLVIAAVESLVIVWLGHRVLGRHARVQIGVIGSPSQALRLREELARSHARDFDVAATITPDDWQLDAAALQSPYLCSLSEVGRAIDERGLEILVVTSEFPSARVDEQLYKEVIARPVQVMPLHEFHERRFGAVPLAEIDYAWFTALAGSHGHPLRRVTKRLIDLAITIPLAILMAPVAAVIALAVRRDGGPALFRQERIGRNGKPFRIYKFRTMDQQPDSAATWTTVDDDRITPAGKFLRKSHLDELPQVWNVIKGEMSIVGPRPEQGTYVSQLQELIPFYGQRHIAKPGVTGWAQVRAGYAGSLEGTAVKLCNDLYYVKHHSVSLDLAIMLETVRALVADRQFGVQFANEDTMLGEGSRRVLADLAGEDRLGSRPAPPRERVSSS